MRRSQCAHVAPTETPPRADACEECGARSALRACISCGHVGCCESQQGHNTQHARAAGHPVIREVSATGDGFVWCYDCGAYLE